MLRIALCDDQNNELDELKIAIEKAVFAHTDYDFERYHSGVDVIEAIEQNDFWADILFLDIHMPGMNGLKVAEYIRKNEVDVDIIFFTISVEDIFEGYNQNV